MHHANTWLAPLLLHCGYIRRRLPPCKTWLYFWSSLFLELNSYFLSWSKFCCKDSLICHVWHIYLVWSFMVVSLSSAFNCHFYASCFSHWKRYYHLIGERCLKLISNSSFLAYLFIWDLYVVSLPSITPQFDRSVTELSTEQHIWILVKYIFKNDKPVKLEAVVFC